MTIRVSTGGGKGVVTSGGFRSMGLTSPVPRSSLSHNPQSPVTGGRPSSRASSGGGRYCSASKGEGGEEVSSEFVQYTVHIPPTPDRPPISEAKPERSYISGTIFTGGFNSVTRGHVMDCSADIPEGAKPPAGVVCGMNGCDGEAFASDAKPPCECGFVICKECYLECLGTGGQCPGCKEPYRDDSGGEEEEEGESKSPAEDQALPLASMAEVRLNRRLSLMKSTKVPDFDHTRWLYETKGTYGYGNAVWPRDGYGGGAGVNGFEDPPNFLEKSKRPLTRKVGVSAAILSPYRYRF